MKLVANNIAVEDVQSKEKMSEGGIIIATSDDMRTPIKSKVVCTGPEVKTVAVGDTVYFSPRSGDIVKTTEGSYKVMPETDVLLVE